MIDTAEVVSELLTVNTGEQEERAAELTAVIRIAGGLHLISGKLAIEIELDREDTVIRVRRALAEVFRMRSTAMRLTLGGGKNRQLLVRIAEGDMLARRLGLLDAFKRPLRGMPNRVVTGNQQELAALLRGAFLARGHLTMPGRVNGLDILCPNAEVAMALVGAASRLGIVAKHRVLRGASRLQLRENKEVAEFLRVMGAPDAAGEWVEACKLRETRANANRLVNFDDANLRRSAQAAVLACARVERAFEILGGNVPEHLLSAGRLRLEYKDASLDDLGARAQPKLTKDAVAGRIRRLLAMADKEAANRGIPNTEGI